MEYRLQIKDLKNPEDLAKLVSAISDISEKLDVIYTTTAPNGNISARQGRIALYNNSGSYEQWENVDGATTWQRIDYGGGLPAGAIWMYGGGSAPTGWLACTGAAVSRTTYAALFTAIGTTYGAGDGSTTFTLPNFTSKIPRGNTPGTGGGADTVTLSEANLPSHTHTGPSHTHAAGTLAVDSQGAHTHDVYGSSGADGEGYMYQIVGDGSSRSFKSVADSAGAHTHTISGATAAEGTGATGAIGSGTAVNTLPAYTSAMFIIKT